MADYNDRTKENSDEIDLRTIKLVYENISLLQKNINLIFENRKLMKRVERAMEFDELVEKVCRVRDASYWKQRCMELEEILKKMLPFCPEGYKGEIYGMLKGMK